MNSTKTRKFILRFILVGAFYSPLANANCDSNKRVYTEIGCQPVYGNNSSKDCPVSYDCENVFSRPNDKCYYDGRVYKPKERFVLSPFNAEISPCIAPCFCHPTSYNNKTVAKFHCRNQECQTNLKLPVESCFYQYSNKFCCEIGWFCPEERPFVKLLECTYNGNVYKEGQRIYIDDITQCVCSESFNGTFNKESCRKLSCHIEFHHMDKILNWSAPIFYEKADGCPIDWYNSDYDIATPYATSATSMTVSGGPVCRYGNLSFPVGQNITIGGEKSNSEVYKTTCSCSIPPLVTCIRTRHN